MWTSFLDTAGQQAESSMRCHYIPGKFSEARRRRRPKSDPLLRTITCHIMSQMRIQTHTCSDARRVATAPRWCRAAATPELELTRTKLSPGAVAQLQPAHRDGPEALPVPVTRQVLAATKLSDFAGWVPDSTQHQPALPAVPGVAMRAGVLGLVQVSWSHDQDNPTPSGRTPSHQQGHVSQRYS